MLLTLCYIPLAIAILLTAHRLFRGPTPADRVLAIDLLAIIVGGTVLLIALKSGQAVFIDIVVVLGVVVFFGTVAIARTLSRESKRARASHAAEPER